MKQFIRFTAVVVLFLLLGLSMASAQEVAYVPGPTVTAATPADNGGFSWGDINGDGYLDILIPSNNILINSAGASFAPAVSTLTANVTVNPNVIGMLWADFDGDGVLDVFTTNGNSSAPGLYYNVGGVLTAASGGDLGKTGVTGENFQGSAAAPIDHSNYLSLAWPGAFTGIAGNNPVPGYGAMWFLKGGAGGFTNIARGAAGGNLAIDTSLSFEAWDVRFFDANNDGYQDLLMPSFRCGFARIDTGSSGARKGCVLFVNDGTGKFIVPTGTSLARTIYSVGAGNVVSTTADTGIIVDDTVRHFTAIGEQWGDLNNDGNEDLVLNALGGTDNYDGRGQFVADVILYGKGDGTFTYTWNGVNVVPSNGLTQATGQRSISIGDYNNDGLADIFTCVTNGGANHLYRNNGDGTFTDVVTGDGANSAAGSNRAGQFVDYNNDGFPDLYLRTASSSVLMRNNGNSNKWIGFIPVGTGHNMSAVGARFTLYYAGTKKQIRDIKSEGGSAGQGGELRALFGIGSSSSIDSVQVNWPDGTTQRWTSGQLAAGDQTVIGKYWTFKEGAIVPAAPARIRPSYIAANDTSLAATDTLRWHSVAGGTYAVTYRAQISTNRGFNPVLKDVQNLTDTTTIARLGLSTQYWWRVRAFSAGYTGAWSAVDSFKTLYTPCTTTPTPLFPAANTITVPNKPNLKVSYVGTASTYHIQVDSVNRFTTNLVLNDSVNIQDTSYTFANSLTPGKKYYWRVRGWNAAGSSAFSAVDSFTIMFTPAVPVLAFPGHNAANVSVPVTFKWNHVNGDSNFVIQVWTYTFSGQALTSDTTKHDTSITKTGYLNRQKYYWKVMAFNQGGASAFTAADSFTTVIEVPGSPNPLGPKNPAKGDMRTIFTWSSVLNATSYHLQVNNANSFSGTISEDIYTTSTDTTLRIPDTLLANTQYYWRVSAVNIGGEGAFSSTAFYITTGVVAVENAASQLPKEFALQQNFPNPFNPTTTISYDLPKAAFVSLKVYDVLGREVATLADGLQAASSYKVQFNGSRLSSGVYFYHLTARSQDGSTNFTSVKKLVLMK